MKPKREIMSIADMPKWKKSMAYNEYINFIRNLSDAVKGKKLDENESLENKLPIIKNLVKLLTTLSNWVDEIPPIQQPQRFGNKAFREWFAKLKENSASLVKECLTSVPDIDENAVEEIAAYLVESFGNETRIDYGTGHEMAFAMLLMCLYKCHALKQEDSRDVINIVFNRYLKLARKLQLTYNMEPAGSHGVWSLDDFQFLPFIFGSSQLLGQEQIEPRHFVEADYIDKYESQYMFFGCLKFITTVKHGPFAEHSNQLWNISSVAQWSKVNSGLIKMYTAEVLDKFPVVQHILFGSYLSIEPHKP